jgi:enoyl-CoA hydratase/carnithine racemase
VITNLETLDMTLVDGIVKVELNRPEKANAISAQMSLDIGTAFRLVDETPAARVAIISGRGRNFTAGG